MQRLAREMRDQPALGGTLGAALAACRDPEAASALLRRHGYDISAAELAGSGAALPDAALDAAAGGWGSAPPFWTGASGVTDAITDAVTKGNTKP